MRSLLSIILLGCAAVHVQTTLAGEARSEGTYDLSGTAEKAVRWLDTNRASFYKAANATIIEHRGQDKYLVSSSTPLGPSTYIVTETETKENDATTYRIKLVKPVSGRVVDMESIVTIRSLGRKSEVTMSASINFRHLLATNRAVRSLTDRSVSDACQLLVKKAR